MHTADWHVGKKLGRIDRAAEFTQVFDELVGLARDQRVDLVVVAGDLLDRAIAPYDALAMVLDVLRRLAEAGGHVVAIAGNHDSVALFDLLAPLVAESRITLASHIRPPSDGGVVTIPSRDGREAASVALFPFLYESQVVDYLADTAEWFKSDDDRVQRICRALAAGLDPSCVRLLTGHFFVSGAELGGGERTVQVGPQYAASAHAIPASVQYCALGHVHRPQDVPGASVPARYSGSVLPLDFSERTHRKEVVFVQASAGTPAKVWTQQLASGRRLLRVSGTIEELRERAEAGEMAGAYLDVRVQTAGPVFGLADEVRRFLPDAVMAQPVWEPKEAGPGGGSAGPERSLADAYGEFHARDKAHGGYGVPAPPELLAAVRELEEEVVAAAPA